MGFFILYLVFGVLMTFKKINEGDKNGMPQTNMKCCKCGTTEIRYWYRDYIIKENGLENASVTNTN